MSAKSSSTRLALYVTSAMVTAAVAGIATVDFSDRKQLASFALSVIATGLITARSYIDTSEAQVPKP